VRDLTADEHQSYDRFGYVKYEAYPEAAAQWSAASGRARSSTAAAAASPRCRASRPRRTPAMKFYGDVLSPSINAHLALARVRVERTAATFVAGLMLPTVLVVAAVLFGFVMGQLSTVATLALEAAIRKRGRRVTKPRAPKELG
jgi:hypothetical protein